MFVLRSLTLFFITMLLSACFQVELIGPVSGASVSIVPLQGGAPVYEGLVSTNVAYHRDDRSPVVWSDYNPFVQLLHLGAVYYDESKFQNATLYLVTASGGRDMDTNSNRVIDTLGSTVGGVWHAIMSGAQIKKGNSRVSLLTDALYRLMEADLEEMSRAEIMASLNQMSTNMVTDLNKDGIIDYLDVLVWSNITRREFYKGPPIFVDRMAYVIMEGLNDSILGAQSSNLVHRATWRPANDEAEYAAALTACTAPVLIGELCTFGDLPLVGMDNRAPVVADIMDRVVVSHSWMIDRLEQVLQALPEDILLLLRSVSAIVVDANIRPSFYDPATAAIYLDAAGFWLTEEERQSISTDEDFRAGFADPMGFWEYWRYVKNDDWAFASFDEVDENGNRQLDDVVLWSANLLFHELAHAADFFPYASLSGLPMTDTPYDTVFETPSDRMIGLYPLQSPELAGMADVLYFGTFPNAVQTAYDGADIGDFFAPDRATDLYAFSNQYEDLAMLFEETMMKIHYNIQRDVAFGDAPVGGIVNSCDDLKLSWGMRGRIAAPQIKNRVKLVLRELLPERSYGALVNGLPEPVMMDSNRNWCENVVLGSGPRLFIRSESLAVKPSTTLPTQVKNIRGRQIRSYR